MRIGIDIDDTICKTCDYLTRLGLEFDRSYKEGKGFKNKHAFRFTDMFDWNKEDVQEFFDYFHKIEGFKDIEVIGEAVKYMRKLKEDGHTIILISHRQPSKYCDVEALTKQYMEQHKIPYDEMHLGINDKGIACKESHVDLMIDDSPEYIADIKKQGIKVLQIKADYDQLLPEEPKYTWKQIYNQIKEEYHG